MVLQVPVRRPTFIHPRAARQGHEPLWRTGCTARPGLVWLAVVEPAVGTRVFVSYAHETPEHVRMVTRLCEFLAERGMDLVFDRWAGVTRRDWSTWAMREMRRADFILAIASPEYQRR